MVVHGSLAASALSLVAVARGVGGRSTRSIRVARKETHWRCTRKFYGQLFFWIPWYCGGKWRIEMKQEDDEEKKFGSVCSAVLYFAVPVT